jgi:3'-phosphoadenosine 5'-phosphosulfate sulfotransferase (PAPS reductase)/FAD synthetase
MQDTPDLASYDKIIINTSAGKDSQAMTDLVVALAREAGVFHRLVLVHADLGRCEWQGTRELAEKHAAAYGLPLIVVHREKGDLLQQVEERGKWPDSQNRYCTSDQKRDQIAKVFTKVVDKLRLGRTARILNCMGLRAQESSARAKKSVFEKDKRASNGKREVHTWLPIHDWQEFQVWARIRTSGVPYHYAYDLGMPRLSCVFCVFAPKAALVIAGKHNPELLEEYVRIEKKIGHTFRNGFRIEEVQEAIAAGQAVEKVESWNM